MDLDTGYTRLVLLCPEWKKWGTAKTATASTVILHSRVDDVVPFAHGEELVRRIDHAWCERGDLVVDLALPVGSRVIKRERYYRAAKPEIRRVYSWGDALLLAAKNRHDGPWDEAEQPKE